MGKLPYYKDLTVLTDLEMLSATDEDNENNGFEPYDWHLKIIFLFFLIRQYYFFSRTLSDDLLLYVRSHRFYKMQILLMDQKILQLQNQLRKKMILSD